MWAGQCSRYSDWLRAGRSGDRSPVGGEIFRTCPDRPWGPPSLLYNGYRVFPGSKERPGRDADPSLPSIAVVMKGQSYTSTPPMGRMACTEHHCLYKVYFTYLIACTGCTLPTSVPVQGVLYLPQCLYRVYFTYLSACTGCTLPTSVPVQGVLYLPQCPYRVYFTFFFYYQLSIISNTTSLVSDRTASGTALWLLYTITVIFMQYENCIRHIANFRSV